MPRDALSRTDIAGAALRLLDDVGFPDLSMRRVAQSLGIAPSALYWHVESKQELLEVMAGDILAGVGAVPAGPWQMALVTWAARVRAALLGHRDGAELVASVLAMRRVRPGDALVEMLCGAGLPDRRARAAAAAVLHFVVGHCVDEQGYEQMVEAGVADDVDATPEAPQERFDYGLGLLVTGLEVALAATRLGP